MTKKKTTETAGKKVTQKKVPDTGAHAATATKSTPKALAASAQTGGRTGTTRLKKTGKTIDTTLMAVDDAILNTTEFIGPPTAVLKEEFSAQKIPLQTNFSDLIDVADCGRKAVGMSPAQQGGTGAGLQLDAEDKLAVLPRANGGVDVSSAGVGVKLSTDGGLRATANGVEVVAGAGITVDSDGVNVDVPFLLPFGMILMFYGTVIPDGWALCDGSNGTPDLRDRFVMGGGSTNENGTANSKASGPSTAKNFTVLTDSKTPTVSVAIANTTLTAAQMPGHFHYGGLQLSNENVPNVTRYGYEVSANGSVQGTINTNEVDWNRTEARLAKTSTTGGGQGHTHELAHCYQASHNHSVNIVPPYCILAFIMKL